MAIAISGLAFHIEEDGLLRIRSVAGVDPRVLPGKYDLAVQLGFFKYIHGLEHNGYAGAVIESFAGNYVVLQLHRRQQRERYIVPNAHKLTHLVCIKAGIAHHIVYRIGLCIVARLLKVRRNCAHNGIEHPFAVHQYLAAGQHPRVNARNGAYAEQAVL